VLDIGGADPAEAATVELRVGLAKERLDRRGAASDAEHGAGARHGVVEIVRKHEAAGARHVLHDEARIAGQEAAHVAGDTLGIEARAAAPRVTHPAVCLVFPAERWGPR